MSRVHEGAGLGAQKKFLKNCEPVIVATEKDFVIVNKPAGLLVHEADSSPGEITLVDWLREKFPHIQNVGDDPTVRPGIVHRLDREASGLIVVALTQEMFDHVKEQFRARTIEKEYLTLVHGRVKNDWGEITLPIARQRGTGRMAARAKGDGDDARAHDAHTEYYVAQRFGNTTLLRVRIHTGRTHQIRVHLFSLGAPVVGDTLYAKRLLAKSFPPAPRLFLHAARLAFFDLSGTRREFFAALPVELATYLKNFKPIT